MSRVNSELLETAIGKHLTLFMGIIDMQTRTLQYSLGAHFPMPILTWGANRGIWKERATAGVI